MTESEKVDGSGPVFSVIMKKTKGTIRKKENFVSKCGENKMCDRSLLFSWKKGDNY